MIFALPPGCVYYEKRKDRKPAAINHPGKCTDFLCTRLAYMMRRSDMD
ncbi:MAG: hypothetical protein OXC84_09420 [Gammaproteobacteria bacterium]|nr:hypothetical protein [Gammaproteobacteria bacterium]